MPQRTPTCQLGRPTSGDSPLISPPSDGTPCPETTLVRGTARQSIDHTASRCTGPRKWLRAVQWLIAAGLHPKANATTMRVAEDLAARMDYTTGHVRYCMLDIAARLGVDKATVKRHIKYLRELGALAWVQHGTLANVRRTLGLGGYAATATVYAAVIPPVYDHAMGHTIVGTGYGARIVIDQRGQAQEPVDNQENPAVDNSGSERCAPPSRTGVKEVGQVDLVGGFNYTSQARRDHESPTQQNSSSNRPTGLKGSTGRTPAQAAQDIRIALQVRPLVNWTQRENERRLAVALRPLIDQGLDAFGIAVRLNNMGPGRWRPKRAAAYISTVLTAQQQREHKRANAEAQYELENPTVGAFQASVSARMDFMTGLRQGIARYQHAMHTRGHDDLSGAADTSTWDAEADILAFLNGSPA